LGQGISLGLHINQLLALKHTCKIQAYIKEFSGLMLEIKDMSEEDRLFHFMNGLQPWVQSDPDARMCKTLVATITTTNKLLDYKVEEKGGPRICEDALGEK
jgi:hypothetical protein